MSEVQRLARMALSCPITRADWEDIARDQLRYGGDQMANRTRNPARAYPSRDTPSSLSRRPTQRPHNLQNDKGPTCHIRKKHFLNKLKALDQVSQSPSYIVRTTTLYAS